MKVCIDRRQYAKNSAQGWKRAIQMVSHVSTTSFASQNVAARFLAGEKLRGSLFAYYLLCYIRQLPPKGVYTGVCRTANSKQRNSHAREFLCHHTLNFFTSFERFSILALFFWVISLTSVTALLICTAPLAISFMLSLITRVSSSSFCIS